jgi:CBS domain-containing protein
MMMNSAIERLLSLRVGDIMNDDVVQISAAATVGEAANILSDNDITGAPVVDGDGRCVGVLSVTDLALLPLHDQRLKALGEALPWSPDATLAKRAHGLFSAGVDPNQPVEDHMSPLVQTIDAAAPIMNAARVLCRERIHRLIIVDDHQRPVGIVSTLDLVASMIAAVEE